MTQHNRIPWFAVFVAAVLLLPARAAAQSGTVTDDGFTSTNATTQFLNLNGQGISLIVAGSSAAVGSVPVGTTKTFIKFQLPSSLPSGTTAANVVKATLKLYLSPLTKPSGAIDIYPVTSAWSESTLNPSSPPTLAATAFVPAGALSSAIAVGPANSFLVVDVTALVQEWTNGPTNGGLANDGIALVADTSTSYVVFDSKESIVTSHEPRLEIVLANTGPQGAVGPQGPQGPQGAQGPQGTQGVAGTPGTAATIKVEAPVVAPAGTLPSVLNGGPPSAADLTFILPQGAVGPQGPQGPIGINNQGPWSMGNSYNVNDAVSFANSYWLSRIPNNTTQPSNSNFKTWQLLAAGINNRGAWNASNSYDGNDAVTDQGSFWLALAPTSANTAIPNTSCEPSQVGCAADWQLLAAQGAQGGQGSAGPQGTQGVQGLTGLQGPPGPMPAGAAITTTANTFTASQTINGNLILTGSGTIQFADGTSQTTASTGGTASCPAAFEVSSTSPIAPAGYTALSQVTAGNVWFTMAPMPTARHALAAASSQGKIYAIGGLITNNGVRSVLSTVEVYDPAANSWSTAASMPTARDSLTAAADAQGNIYAIGGVTANGITSTVEKYNPATNTWSTIASMPTARSSLAAATDSAGKIYAIAGEDALGNPLATVEVYDPTTNAWSTAASLPLARFGLVAATGATGKIYAIGGAINGSPANNLNRVDAYDPATQTWQQVFSMPTARSQLAAAADSTGKIYAIGGLDTNGLIVSTVEVYDPTGGPFGTWSTAASLPTPASNLAAAADAQGKIYAIGVGGPPTGVDQYTPPVTIYTFIKN